MLFGGLVSLFLVTLIALAFRRFAMRSNILLDVPNHRSNHSRVTVRGAGIIFVLSTLVGWWILATFDDATYLVPLIVGAALVAFVSFVDDIRGLPISTRLCAQVAAALVFLYAVPVPNFLTWYVGQPRVPLDTSRCVLHGCNHQHL